MKSFYYSYLVVIMALTMVMAGVLSVSALIGEDILSDDPVEETVIEETIEE